MYCVPYSVLTSCQCGLCVSIFPCYSNFTLLPPQDCNECGHSLDQFNAAESTTFATIPCGQCASTVLPSHAQTGETCEIARPGSPSGQRKCLTSLHSSYVGGDPSYWSAYEARENFYLGGADLGEGITEATIEGTDAPSRHGFPVTFACQSSATGWFSDPGVVRDGVAGFSSAPTSLVQQMYMAGKLPHPRFSLCFNRQLRAKHGNIVTADVNDGSSKNAGVLTLGGFDPAYLTTPIGWANDINHSNLSRQQLLANQGDHRADTSYRVRVTGMYLREGGGQSIMTAPNQAPQGLRGVRFDWRQLGGQGSAAVDSAYPYTILDRGLEGPFLDAWRKATGGGIFSYEPQQLTADELRMMPTIILQFEGSSDKSSVDPNAVPNLAGDLDPERPFDPLVAIPASHYMDYDASTDTFRATLFFDEEASGTGATSVLGANVIQGHNIAHYIDGGKIGFAEAGVCEPLDTATGEAVTETQETAYGAAAAKLKKAEKKGLGQSHLRPGSHAQAQGWYFLDDDMYVGSGTLQDERSYANNYTVKGNGACISTVCRVMMILSYLAFGGLVGAFYVFAKRRQRAMEVEDAAVSGAAASVSRQFDLGHGTAAGSTDTLTRLGILRNNGRRDGSESDEGSAENAQIAAQGGGGQRMSNFRRMYR